jgi:hypothetical protein
VYELVKQRIHDDERPMPQPPNARLDAADLSTLDAWIAQGAPQSTATCDADAASKPDSGLSCTPDVHMAPASAFAMPQNATDLYQCYGFDMPVSAKRHMVGIAPHIDNPNIIHHLVLFQSDSATSSTPGPCNLVAQAKWRLIYGWAPGTKSFELPPEAGFALDEGVAHYVVQIHYNNVHGLANQTDASGFDFCTTSQLRPNDADAVVFGAEKFTIQPRSTLDLTCTYTMPATTPTLHVFAALPHMHQIGESIATTDTGGDGGASVDLGTRPQWDFGNQYYVDLDATISAGDTIRTRCVWTNGTTAPVTYGPYTEDEMCFSYTMYYPRVVDPTWTFLEPADNSQCNPTPSP